MELVLRHVVQGFSQRQAAREMEHVFEAPHTYTSFSTHNMVFAVFFLFLLKKKETAVIRSWDGCLGRVGLYSGDGADGTDP